MPTVFFHNGWQVHFFANEGDPREPVHVHVDRAGATAKVWLYPRVQVANSWGYNRRDLRLIVQMVEERRDEITRFWDAFFSTRT